MRTDPTTDELTRIVLDQSTRRDTLAGALNTLLAALRRVIVATVYLAQALARRHPPTLPARATEEPLLDARQLSHRLGWSEATIYRKAKTGEIPSVKLGKRSTRFRFSEVEKVLRE